MKFGYMVIKSFKMYEQGSDLEKCLKTLSIRYYIEFENSNNTYLNIKNFKLLLRYCIIYYFVFYIKTFIEIHKFIVRTYYTIIL